jgi:capsular polysaccharide export protein
MSKLSKLLKTPHIYFVDAARNRWPGLLNRTLQQKIDASFSDGRPTAILIGFSDWKKWMIDILPDYQVLFLGHSPKVQPSIVRAIPKFHKPHVFVWSYKYPPLLAEVCAQHALPLTHVEDGFLRSVGLGIAKSRPMSLVFDTLGMHFDAARVTELDTLLNSYDFAGNRRLMDEAKLFKEAYSGALTKYLAPDSGRCLRDDLRLAAGDEVVLVLGQVEDDLSIKHGSSFFLSGTDLVQLAAIDNPQARILYRPHPEALQRTKPHYSNPQTVQPLCDIVGPDWSLKECLEVATRIYTVTSLAGFEAALLGKQVDLFGLPFYGGWGFTNDRHSIPLAKKRQRALTTDEVLAGAMLLYAKYYHPVTSAPVSPLEACQIATSLLRQIQRRTTERMTKANTEP